MAPGGKSTSSSYSSQEPSFGAFWPGYDRLQPSGLSKATANSVALKTHEAGGTWIGRPPHLQHAQSGLKCVGRRGPIALDEPRQNNVSLQPNAGFVASSASNRSRADRRGLRLHSDPCLGRRWSGMVCRRPAAAARGNRCARDGRKLRAGSSLPLHRSRRVARCARQSPRRTHGRGPARPYPYRRPFNAVRLDRQRRRQSHRCLVPISALRRYQLRYG